MSSEMTNSMSSIFQKYFSSTDDLIITEDAKVNGADKFDLQFASHNFSVEEKVALLTRIIKDLV